MKYENQEFEERPVITAGLANVNPEDFESWHEERKKGWLEAHVRLMVVMSQRGLSHLLPLILGSDEDYGDVTVGGRKL